MNYPCVGEFRGLASTMVYMQSFIKKSGREDEYFSMMMLCVRVFVGSLPRLLGKSSSIV